MLIKSYSHVAVLASGTRVSWPQFVSDVLCMRSTVREKGDRVALYSKSTYAFMVAMTAILQEEKILVVLQNNLATTLEKYCSSFDDYMELSEEDVLSAEPDISSSDVQEDVYLDDDAKIFFYTSGSSGSSLEVKKTLGQLVLEVSDSSKALGIREHSLIMSTVPHQHLYGFLFKVITPMANGIEVVSPLVRYPSQMGGYERYVLISSPAFLSRLEEDEVIAGAGLILSSGGPLSIEASLNATRTFSCDGYEIFGSTETGGVGYRSFLDAKEFKPFRGVNARCNEEGLLEIRSEYVDPRVWLTTSDRAEIIADERISLQGRADDIVKIEEKRISLSEVAGIISSHYSWIEKTYVVTYEVGRRIKLAALVVANVRLSDYDAERLVENLSKELRGYIDPVFIPKKWKVVNEISVNEMGKVTKETIVSKIFLDHLERESESSIGAL